MHTRSEFQPLISIIVPVYNVEKYLEACVETLINQSYKNLEIILVDDGSTDKSGSICDMLKAQDSRISVYHKQNGGLSDARNFGISKSHGEFLSFIDSDDAIHMDFYSELMQQYDNNASDILSTDILEFHEISEIDNLFSKSYNLKVVTLSSDDALKEYFHHKNNNFQIYHGLCMKIYKRNLFDNLSFEVGRLHEDVYITYKLLDGCNFITLISCPYYFYNKGNASSICSNYTEKNLVDEFDGYVAMYRYFEQRKQITDDLLYFLLQRYRDMSEAAYYLEKSDTTAHVKKEMSIWILANLNKCQSISIIKKFLILLSVKNMSLYIKVKKFAKLILRK